MLFSDPVPERQELVRAAAVDIIRSLVKSNDVDVREAAVQVGKLLSFHNIAKSFSSSTISRTTPPFVENENLMRLVKTGWQTDCVLFRRLRRAQLNGVDAAVVHAMDAQESLSSCIDPTNASNFVDIRPTIPSELICPITRQLIREPFHGSDGYLYERSAAKQVGQMSPITRQPGFCELKISPILVRLLEHFQKIYPPSDDIDDNSDVALQPMIDNASEWADALAAVGAPDNAQQLLSEEIDNSHASSSVIHPIPYHYDSDASDEDWW